MKRFPLALVLAFVVFPAATLAQKASAPEQNPKTPQAYSMLIGSDWPPLKQQQRELELLDKEIQKVMR
jgi:hypothetical protein